MDLTNKKILVTRLPQHSTELLTAIRKLNGIAICQPLFSVEPLLTANDIATIRLKSQLADLGIFISRSAVDIIMPVLDRNLTWYWAAIGPGTARHLASYGVHKVWYPYNAPANSKTMLDHILASKIVVNRKQVMIFTGVNGDAWLTTAMQNLGANVEVIAAYRRKLPDDLQLDLDVDVIFITCMTSLINLKFLAPGHLATPLIVVSERIRQAALEMGYSTVYTSESMANQDILSALMKVNECKTQ